MYGAPTYISELIASGITALVTAFLTWFFSRKKLATEVESLELDLVDRAITIWRTQSETLSSQMTTVLKDNAGMRKDLDEMRRENESLKKENESLKKENTVIRQQVEKLRKRLNTYEKTMTDSHD